MTVWRGPNRTAKNGSDFSLLPLCLDFLHKQVGFPTFSAPREQPDTLGKTGTQQHLIHIPVVKRHDECLHITEKIELFSYFLPDAHEKLVVRLPDIGQNTDGGPDDRLQRGHFIRSGNAGFKNAEL